MGKWSFTEHPRSVGETYGEHFLTALGFGARMLGGGLACLVHAVLPFLCTRTGSNTIGMLHDRMIANRSRLGNGSLEGRHPSRGELTLRSGS
jgi:hypothetical protein